MCTARAFLQRGRPLCTQILPGQVRLQQPFLASETKDTGLPDGETVSLCVPHFDTVPECDEQTDGRIFAVAHTALAKLALRRTVKGGSRSTACRHHWQKRFKRIYGYCREKVNLNSYGLLCASEHSWVHCIVFFII